MRCLLAVCLVCLLLGCARPYVEGGIAVYDQAGGYPEMQWERPELAYIQVGVERDGWSFYAEHESSPFYRETGSGRNSLGVSKRLYLFETD